MLTAIYCIVSIWVFFKLMKVLVKATWGLTKCVIGLIFWPIVIIMALLGLIWIALPILLIIGIMSMAVAL
ncbi:MAG: hypothetical protein K6E34_08915 [Lachnospiraceae bacterium]|nr:hypothetical protein [Lachnospiraceae bacterium]